MVDCREYSRAVDSRLAGEVVGKRAWEDKDRKKLDLLPKLIISYVKA